MSNPFAFGRGRGVTPPFEIGEAFYAPQVYLSARHWSYPLKSLKIAKIYCARALRIWKKKSFEMRLNQARLRTHTRTRPSQADAKKETVSVFQGHNSFNLSQDLQKHLSNFIFINILHCSTLFDSLSL